MTPCSLPPETVLTLPQAWSYWWQGCHLDEHLRMWGLYMLWWARIGKLLQCVAGLTIIAEIIGPERLRAFGNSLHNRVTLDGAVAHTRSMWRVIRGFIFWGQFSRDRPQEQSRALTVFVLVAVSLLSGAVLGLANEMIIGDGPLSKYSTLIFLLMFTTGLVMPVFVLIMTVAWLGLGVIVDAVLIEPIALALDRPALDRIVKIGALLLLLIGFHFDFLTS
jgi:hypothetical protein